MKRCLTFVIRQFAMKKVTTLVLLLCLVLLGAWSYANGVTRTKNTQTKGIPIEIKNSICVSGSDRSSSIVASINGHTLSVVFLENLGQVHVEVDSVSGGETQYQSTPTPDGMDFFITDTGSYIVYFNLSNGDVYYGEFEVTD